MSDQDRVRADASYILDWLRRSSAPAAIVALQERVVEDLGGFVSAEERIMGLAHLVGERGSDTE